MPRQRAQRRQREQRDQRQWQGRRERLEKRREKREKERSREAVQETIYNVYTENQTDLPHPFRQEPQIEHFPGPQVEHVQELQVEHAQEPRVQRLPPLGNARFWVSLLSLGFLLGYWIGRAVARRAPRAAEAFHLAIRVSALETGRFVFSSLNQLARAWAHAVSTNGGFVEYVVLLVMLVLLIGHYGNMYLGRGEYVPLVLNSFLLPALCFVDFCLLALFG
jgi:hypothetical protein